MIERRKATLRASWSDPEIRARRLALINERVQDPAYREQSRKAALQRVDRSPEAAQRRSEEARVIATRLGELARRRATMKSTWADPAKRVNLLTAIKTAKADHEYRSAASARHKAMWEEDSKYREKVIEASRAAMADPTLRERMGWLQPEAIARALDAVRAGRKIAHIAAEAGVGTRSIYHYMKTHGVTRPNPRPPTRIACVGLSPAEIAGAMGQVRAGVSVSVIAQRLGASVTTIYNYMRKLGVTRPGQIDRLSRADIIGAVNDARTGMAEVEIAERIGVAVKKVRSHLSANGIVARKVRTQTPTMAQGQKRLRLSSSQVANAMADVRAGVRVTEVAARFGTTIVTIYAHMKRNGVAPPSKYTDSNSA